jgi:hypothetical protein
MATGSISHAIEEFLSLNQRFTICGLEDEEHRRWALLAHALDGAAVRTAARGRDLTVTRKHARAPLCLHVRFLLPEHLGTAHTLDVSCAGCALEVDRELHRGAEVELALRLPNQLGSLDVSGWVCWVAPARRPSSWRVGISFAGLTARERDLLASCVLAEVAPRLAEA